MSIDASKCQGHALCLELSPENFDFDDVAGAAFVTDSNVLPTTEPAIRRAVASCPERAIDFR